VYYRVILFFLILSTPYIFADSLEIDNIYPSNPYVGMPVLITGSGFDTAENTLLTINEIPIHFDSPSILEWTDSSITLLMPDALDRTFLRMKNSNGTTGRILKSRRLCDVEYFNPTRYTLVYTVKIKSVSWKNEERGRVYLYIPQPVLSDTLTSITTVSISREPDFIQDNGILIYEIHPDHDSGWELRQEISVVTWYKKYDLTDDIKIPAWPKKTELWDLYTAAAEPFILPEHSSIISKKDSLIGEEVHKIDQARLIFNWVAKHMRHQFPPDSRNPIVCMRTGTGDCLSDAFLFTSLVRSLPVPVRLNSGYIFYHTWWVGGRHFWEEAFFPGVGWLPVDMSFGHNTGFLRKHRYPTEKSFYFGGMDGRRMALNKGRRRLMMPDDSGELQFFRYMDNMQVPGIFSDNSKVSIASRVSKPVQIVEIEPLYKPENDWFKSSQDVSVDVFVR
jgi:hypothetical protein